MRIVNLAHAVLMVGAAYLSYWGFVLLGIDPILSIAITVPVMFVVGVVIYKVVFTNIPSSARLGETTVLLTFSLALIFEGLLGYAFTNIYRTANTPYATEAILLGPFYLPKGQFYATTISVGLLVLLWAFLQYARTGNAIRATMQNPTAAQVVGVNVEQTSTIAFGLGVALAGASGSMMSFLFTFYAGMHWEWVAILLSLIVLGGMGSLLGALVGSVLLAVAAGYVSNFLGPTWSPITFFLALFIILLVRPQGLFGKPIEAS
jgi:branched-chain amino acid transport system permease protein